MKVWKAHPTICFAQEELRRYCLQMDPVSQVDIAILPMPETMRDKLLEGRNEEQCDAFAADVVNGKGTLYAISPRSALLGVYQLLRHGQHAGLLHCDGIRPMDISGHLSNGNNRISLRVCGTFKNLMGPHFVKARGTAWPAMWQESPEFMPDASEYDLLNYGLATQPTLCIRNNAEVKEVFT